MRMIPSFAVKIELGVHFRINGRLPGIRHGQNVAVRHRHANRLTPDFWDVISRHLMQNYEFHVLPLFGQGKVL
jgi:hypothetical protein